MVWCSAAHAVEAIRAMVTRALLIMVAGLTEVMYRPSLTERVYRFV
jgi:hypothetical protein